MYNKNDHVLCYYLDEWLTGKVIDVRPDGTYELEVCLLAKRKPGLVTVRVVLPESKLRSIKILKAV